MSDEREYHLPRNNRWGIHPRGKSPDTKAPTPDQKAKEKPTESLGRRRSRIAGLEAEIDRLKTVIVGAAMGATDNLLAEAKRIVEADSELDRALDLEIDAVESQESGSPLPSSPDGGLGPGSGPEGQGSAKETPPEAQERSPELVGVRQGGLWLVEMYGRVGSGKTVQDALDSLFRGMGGA